MEKFKLAYSKIKKWFYTKILDRKYYRTGKCKMCGRCCEKIYVKHGSSVLKDEEIYNIFNTEKILNRPASVLISKTSGLAGIAYWINENYSLSGALAVDKKDPLVIALKEWIDKLYEDGRVASLSNDELEEKINELSNGSLRKTN